MNEPYQLPVRVSTVHIRRPNLDLAYPRVLGLENQTAQDKMNAAITREVQKQLQEQGYLQHPEKTEVTAYYETKTNERGVLSLTLSNYAYTQHMAHGLTLLNGLTFDTGTGSSYRLGDLFKPGSDYIRVISDIVRAQIRERDVPLLDEFKGIRPDQDFYIADKALVVFFQLYEITPYVYGFPMFPISVYALQDIIPETGPLSPMLMNS